MKRETIDVLSRDLNNHKEREESFKKNSDFVYEIEFVPVLTKRNKQGKLEELTNSSYGLLLANENRN